MPDELPLRLCEYIDLSLLKVPSVPWDNADTVAGKKWYDSSGGRVTAGSSAYGLFFLFLSK